MSEPRRAQEPEPSAGHDDVPGDLTLAELVQRAREHAEAEAAVAAVMRREDEKAAKREAIEQRQHHEPPVRILLLLGLVLFNAYLWFGNPAWLSYRRPEAPSIDYYQDSWKIAVFLQRQRIEEYRRVKGSLPVSAQQAGQPVDGVKYTPLEQRNYQLAAGDGAAKVVFRSTDSLSVLMGRTLLQMGLVAGGLR